MNNRKYGASIVVTIGILLGIALFATRYSGAGSFIENAHLFLVPVSGAIVVSYIVKKLRNGK